MAQCSAHPAVPIALLLLGLVAVLLLTVPTEDIQETPGFMVRSARWVFLDPGLPACEVVEMCKQTPADWTVKKNQRTVVVQDRHSTTWILD